jgi:DNA-binding protein HU-beta
MGAAATTVADVRTGRATNDERAAGATARTALPMVAGRTTAAPQGTGAETPVAPATRAGGSRTVAETVPTGAETAGVTATGTAAAPTGRRVTVRAMVGDTGKVRPVPTGARVPRERIAHTGATTGVGTTARAEVVTIRTVVVEGETETSVSTAPAALAGGATAWIDATAVIAGTRSAATAAIAAMRAGTSRTAARAKTAATAVTAGAMTAATTRTVGAGSAATAGTGDRTIAETTRTA